MRPEIRAAAQWWANQLRGAPVQDNGDGLQSLLLSVAATRRRPLSEEEVQRFESALADLLEQRISASLREAEAKANPIWGSGHRIVATDYDPDPILAEACQAAGFAAGLRFPIKTVMWINPGEVTLSNGYRAPIEPLAMSEEEATDA